MADTKTAKPKTSRSAAKTQPGRVLPPPANVLPPGSPHYLRTILITVGVGICVIVTAIGVWLGHTAQNIGSDCDQKVQAATHQAQQQANQLKGIVLSGSKPTVTKSLDDDCLDGSGTGTATAAYPVQNTGFTQANDEVMQTLGGTETAVVLNDNTDDISNPSGASLTTTSVDQVTAAIKTSDGTSYLVQFVFTAPYDCSAAAGGTCTDDSTVIQTYGFQNEPIKEITISLNNLD
ncbi:MAG TPA: hypothetical protein VGM08_02350 [Candidatus Saccharimonadales bacterium]|jgi:hypothetical protein